MSVDLFVFLERPNLPTTVQWQHALDQLGFDVHLDDAVDPAHHSGFWPARCGTRQLGFEYYVGSIPDAFGREPPTGLGVRDFVVNFVTHSDLQELRCAMLAAAALAEEADGLVFDDDSGGLVGGSTLIDQAQSIPPPS